MRIWLLASVVACLVPAFALAQSGRRPVVVELFTSQGCSSCPPADAIVAELARIRPDVLALTFHVTYWNNLGWADPFSLAAATERQRRYVSLSVSPDVYTPAMVIDGQQDVVGSDRPAVDAALARAEAAVRTVAPVVVSRAGDAVEIVVGAGSERGSVLLLGYDTEHQNSHRAWREPRPHVGRAKHRPLDERGRRLDRTDHASEGGDPDRGARGRHRPGR